ncbi:MAG: aspartate 1-decarboxylase [Planctomycetes bacterium]|nr:aspartate 1-decarboxylase [Planctomycetota bacterium]
MLRKMLRAKIHRAVVTQCDPDYVGSITIDADLLRAVDIRPNEAVHVADIDNAERFETYVIRGEPGSGIIGVNGAAASLVKPGHRLIIMCYGFMQERELDAHESRIVVAGAGNKIERELRYPSLIDELEPTR